MLYLTGTKALNLECELETGGDWHTSSMNWKNINLVESDGSVFGDYGIEKDKKIPDTDILYNTANHIRALLDLIIDGNFASAQGMNNDFICNDKYDNEIFSLVYSLKSFNHWEDINLFMEREYKMKWVNFYNIKRSETYERLDKRA